ncbi:MAG: branched-chain amino acid ABC transporter permease [Armatimonadetes bacterium]|nr:branched-chain amino acid ABC transporter permease [Armatimonadota bacterium]
MNLVAGLDFSILPQQLVNGLLLGSIYALIALGYTMVYGVLRLINFAHGEVFMLGSYAALFTSWLLGFSPEAVRGVDRPSTWVNLVVMLLVSMIVCGLIGVLIEFLAYRPMRNQPRIASLITAIGVSLFIQYAGGLFLPQSPPPAISEQVNPYRNEKVSIVLKPAGQEIVAQAADATKKAAIAEKAYDDAQKAGAPADKVEQLRNDAQIASNDASRLQTQVSSQTSGLVIPYGQLGMLITTMVLMAVLWFVVQKTKTGRAMRAVAHDFDSAALMGVNVGRIITITFMIGSALAGAGAMMYATVLRTPLSPFLGVQPGVKAFVAAVLGGIGNIPGAVLGGILMGIVETLVVWLDGLVPGLSGYKDAVAFVVLIAVLLFRPGGLLGSSKVEKV